MINAIFEGKWKELRGQIDKWRNQRSQAELIDHNNQHKQFIGILQKRYGYTEEKATDELNKHYSKIKLG